MWNVVKVFILFMYLLLLSIYDFREKKVPCLLLEAGGAVIILWAGAECLWKNREGMDIIRGMIPGGGLLMTAVFTGKAGRADGIVLVLIGILEGFRSSMFLLCGSLFLMAVCSVILLLLRKVKINTRIPYLPFVCIAYLGMNLNVYRG